MCTRDKYSASDAVGPTEQGGNHVARLALICGSLEPGRDGVGDYSLRLARALAAQGVQVSLLALADRFVAEPVAPESHILRLPARLSGAERHALGSRALATWAPDWNSLQFVSWAHGPKGIVTREASLLQRLLAGRPLHLMVHEPWVTDALEMVPFRIKRLRRHLLGYLQKRSIARLFQKLQPALVNTSNAVYQRLLSDIGVSATQLPLFGNIEVAPPGDWQSLRALVRETAQLELGEDRRTVLLAGLFGAVRPCPVEPALKALVAAAGERRAVLLSLGEAGPGGRERLAAWQQEAPGLEIGMVGPLDPVRLSNCFDQLDAAVSLHPAWVIGRSGAAAAMLEHGVPVISPWGPPPPSDDAFASRWDGMLRSVDADLTGFLRDRPVRRRYPGVVDATAQQLLRAMTA